MERSIMRSLKLLLAMMILGTWPSVWAQSPTYGVGTAPSAEELRAADISISPTGKELPPGSGTAKEGAQIYSQKCALCHGDTGGGGLAPKLVKGATPAVAGPCISPCINDNNVMAMHAPYATVMWDYINRGMPFSQEGSLKANEVYALTAFVLFKNSVIPEDKVLDAQSLPQIQMPNRDGYALPDFKPGLPRPLYSSAAVGAGQLKGMYVGAGIVFLVLLSLIWVTWRRRGDKEARIRHGAQSV
jgi:S-disulfanyl-L-cysteine oxidoreductase SoxD